MSAGRDGVLGGVITLVCSLIGLQTLVSHHHDLFCGPRAGAGGVEQERLLSWKGARAPIYWET